MRNRPTFLTLNNPKSIVDVFLEKPKKYMVALTLAQEVLREPSALSPQDRELIAAFTSKLNKCEYCFGSHKAFTESIDAEQSDITCVLVEDNYSGHRLESILNYVKKLTLSPASVEQSDLEAVLSAGFSEDELKDAIAVCAAFNFYNRIVEGHGIAENADTWPQAAQMINELGYDRRYDNQSHLEQVN
jgi:uncharacterized peroxidase-related enzyme